MLKQKGILRRDFTKKANSKSKGIVVVGDVHGCADALKQIVKQIRDLPYSPTVVFVGDLLDRGPQGPEVWDLVRRLYYSPKAFNAEKVVVLKGNHEQLFVDAFYSMSVLDSSYLLWMQNGGKIGDMKYVENYSEGLNELKWMESLNSYYIHDNKIKFRNKNLNLIVTHGCVKPEAQGGHVKIQPPEYLFWQRNIAGYGNEWLTIHGHTIQKTKEPTIHSTLTGDVMMIDTGSFWSGVVTGVEFIEV